jgi:hypothetical protein
MGNSYTLKYQLGRYYTIRLPDTDKEPLIDENWLVIEQRPYKKKNGLMGERVTLQNVVTGKKLEREQQYRKVGR